MNRSADILVRFWGRRNAEADKNVRAPEKCEMRTVMAHYIKRTFDFALWAWDS